MKEALNYFVAHGTNCEGANSPLALDVSLVPAQAVPAWVVQPLCAKKLAHLGPPRHSSPKKVQFSPRP